MKGMLMELRDICEKVMDIEEGLMVGEIQFRYDNLMSAMKPGHPMEILDSIIAEIFWDVMSGKEPAKEKIISVINNMKDFKNTFEIDEVEPVIDDLERYVKEMDK